MHLEASHLICQPSSAPTLNSHLRSTLRGLSHASVGETGLQSNFSHCSAVLCINLCFHSCIHSDAQCHLKLNSEENQYDKLLLVLSLNCFTLEIDTGARAIHHRLREVGTPRENRRASMWSRKKENAMGVSVGWVKTEVSSWQAGGELRNKDEEQEKRREMLCFSILPPLFL